MLLFWWSVFDCTFRGVIYVRNTIKKLGQLPSKALQNVFAYDFYNPDLYRLNIVFAVDPISKIIDRVTRFIVDSTVNLVGLASILGRESCEV